MKVGEAIAEIMKREGIEILCGYPVNHLLEFAAKADIRPIKIGPRYKGQVVVTEGLKEGEKVIVEGVQKVRPGMVVTAKPYQEPTAKTGNSHPAQEERKLAAS